MASPRTPRGTHKNDSLSLAAPPSSISAPHNQPTARITPAVLFIIVILAVIFFISGLLHLLIRFISRSSSRPSDPAGESIPTVDSRQLQQLFHLHDSGLDQSLIDSLPVFSFRSVLGPRRPEAFDCAICLSEFGQDDRLRLLPDCGHAFHLSCIDTWLLANSTCPLCRGSMLLAMDSLLGIMYDDNLDDDALHKFDDGDDGSAAHNHDDDVVNKVFSVKLGKFRKNLSARRDGDDGESSGSNDTASVDGRRCFSMGSFQYVVGEPSLSVKLGLVKHTSGSRSGQAGLDLDGKRLSGGSRRDSLSISKIWLWPRKGPLIEEKDASCSKDRLCNGV